MAGVQDSDPVLICIYTKKTLRRLRVAILESQKEKERLHDGRGKKGVSVRHETRHFGAGLMTLEIQFRSRRSSGRRALWLRLEIISLARSISVARHVAARSHGRSLKFVRKLTLLDTY